MTARTSGRPVEGLRATALGAVLEERGIKHRWMAGKLGIHPGHLSHVIVGRRRLAVPQAVRASEVLGVPVFMLFDLSNESVSLSSDNSERGAA